MTESRRSRRLFCYADYNEKAKERGVSSVDNAASEMIHDMKPDAAWEG